MSRVLSGIAMVGAAGFGLGVGFAVGHAAAPAATPASPPAQGVPIDATSVAGLADVRNSLEALRREVAALRASLAPAPTDGRFSAAALRQGEAVYVGSSVAHFRGTLLRQRMADAEYLTDVEDDAQKREVVERAIETIDATLKNLDTVRSVTELVRWFDQMSALRRQWPASRAWLLPDLEWR